jgi:hypothetical protein
MIRHFPDNLPVWGNYTPAPFVEGTEVSPRASDNLTPRLSCARAATYRYFPSSRCTSPVIFTLPSIAPVYAGAGLGRKSSISLRIFRNKSLGTATSANWNVTYRPWLTTFAPIFTNFSGSVVRDQSPTGLARPRSPRSHHFEPYRTSKSPLLRASRCWLRGWAAWWRC